MVCLPVGWIVVRHLHRKLKIQASPRRRENPKCRPSGVATMHMVARGKRLRMSLGLTCRASIARSTSNRLLCRSQTADITPQELRSRMQLHSHLSPVSIPRPRVLVAQGSRIRGRNRSCISFFALLAFLPRHTWSSHGDFQDELDKGSQSVGSVCVEDCEGVS